MYLSVIAEKTVQRVERGGEVKVDARIKPRLLPVSLRDVCPLLAEIATDEPSIPGQRGGDGNGAVAGEGADLDGALCADGGDEQREEGALIRTDLHARGGEIRRFFAKPRLHIRLMRERGRNLPARPVQGWGQVQKAEAARAHRAS